MDWYVLEGAAKPARPCQILKLIGTDVQVQAPIPWSCAFLFCPVSVDTWRGWCFMLGCQGPVTLHSLSSGCCSEGSWWVYFGLSVLQVLWVYCSSDVLCHKSSSMLQLGPGFWEGPVPAEGDVFSSNISLTRFSKGFGIQHAFCHLKTDLSCMRWTWLRRRPWDPVLSSLFHLCKPLSLMSHCLCLLHIFHLLISRSVSA